MKKYFFRIVLFVSLISVYAQTAHSQAKTLTIIDSISTGTGSGTVTVSGAEGGSLLLIQSRYNPAYSVPADWEQVGSFEVSTSIDGTITTTVSKRTASGINYSVPVSGNYSLSTMISFSEIWDYEVFHTQIYENSPRSISIESNNNGRPVIFIVQMMYAWPSSAITMTPSEGVTVFEDPNVAFGRAGVRFLFHEDNGGTKNINISDFSRGDGPVLVIGIYLK